MIFALTGKVGSGKNLYACKLIEKYAFEGRRVVTNFSVDLSPLQTWWDRFRGRPVPTVEKIPGRPTFSDVAKLGKGGEREHVAGLLVLDEVGPLLNARSWQDKERGKFIDWLLHSRKLAWDVVLIVQNVALVDKQVRVACIESLITVKRFDRMKWLGLRLPRIHFALERYGVEPNAPIAEKHMFRGTRYFNVYDTTELLGEFEDVAPSDVLETTDTPEVVTKGASLYQWRRHIRSFKDAERNRRRLRAAISSGEPLIATRDAHAFRWLHVPRLQQSGSRLCRPHQSLPANLAERYVLHADLSGKSSPGKLLQGVPAQSFDS